MIRKLIRAYTLWIISLTLVVLVAPASAINFNNVSVKGLGRAYGFVLAQEYSLARIEAEFPELSGNVKLSRAHFASAFYAISEKLELQLTEALGEITFQQLKAELKAQLPARLGNQKVTLESASIFLDEVGRRARGEIETPVLQYLLAVKYRERPAGEFADGFRQRFQTDGTGKSQGIQLVLQLPRSWSAAEGERPHIVQKWTSENGTGLEMIHLDIRDAQGYAPTRKEMDEFVKSGEVKDVVPRESTHVASGSFSLERQAGYWLQMTMPVERGEFKWHTDAIMYQLFFRVKAVAITCQAGAPENEKFKSREAFDRIRPLCQQVLNSLVLPQAY